MMLYALSPSTWNVEIESSEVQVPQQHSEFQTSLEYMNASHGLNLSVGGSAAAD